jgi:hypothetical protein
MQLVPLELENGTKLYIESVEDTEVSERSFIGGNSADEVGEKTINIAKELLKPITSFCSILATNFNELDSAQRPKKASVSFGVTVSAEGNIYIVKGTGTANITVTGEWEF